LKTLDHLIIDHLVAGSFSAVYLREKTFDEICFLQNFLCSSFFRLNICSIRLFVVKWSWYLNLLQLNGTIKSTNSPALQESLFVSTVVPVVDVVFVVTPVSLCDICMGVDVGSVTHIPKILPGGKLSMEHPLSAAANLWNSKENTNNKNNNHNNVPENNFTNAITAMQSHLQPLADALGLPVN
jgi:hypothetical protein